MLGTFLPKAVNNNTYRYTDCDIVHEAQALNVSIQRVQQIVDTTELNSTVIRLHDAGIASHLVLKANPGLPAALLPDDPNIPGDENSGAGTTVTEYRRQVAARLDEYHTLTGAPAPLVAIENESNHDEFYNGTAADYLEELGIATEVAHERSIKITDSGIAAKATKLVVWNQIRLTSGTAAADQYLSTVFRSASNPNDLGIRNDLLGISPTDPDPYVHLGSTILQQSWHDAETMINSYGTAAGKIPIDYVNFHWYTPDEANATSYSDRQALADTIDALGAITGLPVVSNEIGQHGTDVQAVTDTLEIALSAKRLALVIWFDADGDPAHGLFEPTRPGTLRPTGEAFRTYTAPSAYQPSDCD